MSFLSQYYTICWQDFLSQYATEDKPTVQVILVRDGSVRKVYFLNVRKLAYMITLLCVCVCVCVCMYLRYVCVCLRVCPASNFWNNRLPRKLAWMFCHLMSWIACTLMKLIITAFWTHELTRREQHKFHIGGILGKYVTNGSKTAVMDVICFLCLLLRSSTSLGMRRACACSEVGFSSQNCDCAWGVFYRRAAFCCAFSMGKRTKCKGCSLRNVSCLRWEVFVA
jgi:hypothetical protein